MSSDDKRQESLAILRTLREAGFESYWAGGCVRDLLLGREPKDFDIATRATPEEVQALFPRVLDVGKAYGVVRVVLGHQSHEVATFRQDLAYRDGRHPETVAFTGPEEDAWRRDFTINGMFFDPLTKEVRDFVGGQADLRQALVRAIGDPDQRLQEDCLRLLRAVRLASTLEFRIEPRTLDAIRRNAEYIRHVSAERIQQELTRLLVESPKAGQGVRLLHELGLLRVLLPEVDRMAHQEQPPAFHPEGDVLTHTIQMLDAMENPTPSLAYAVLLHDVGKPPTARLAREPDGHERIRFDRHAQVGKEIAQDILQRLRLPKRIIEEVVYAVGNHMRFMDVPRMRRSTLRQLVGAKTFPEELELHRLDCLCSHGDLSNHELLRRFMEELENEPVLPEPWVNGHDLMELGIPEGPQVGHWHRKAYEAQLEGRFDNRDELLAWLRDELSKIDGKS